MARGRVWLTAEETFLPVRAILYTPDPPVSPPQLLMRHRPALCRLLMAGLFCAAAGAAAAQGDAEPGR